MRKTFAEGSLVMSQDPQGFMVPSIALHGPYEYIRTRKGGEMELRDPSTGKISVHAPRHVFLYEISKKEEV
jgi:hypothetical protein